MSIAKRLAILVLSSIVALLLLAGINYQQMNRVFEATNFNSVNTVPSILVLNEAMLDFSRVRIRVYRHVLNNDPKALADIDKSIVEALDKTDRALRDYEKLLSDDDDKRLLEADRSLLAEYRLDVEKTLSASRQNRKEEAIADLKGAVGAATKLNDALVAHMKYNDELGKKSAAEGEAAKSRATWVAIVITLLALAAMAALGLAIVRSLVSRVEMANQLAERIAAGDLSAVSNMSSGNDEIGRLLQSLEKMRGDLANTIRDIVAEANTVQASASQVSAAAHQVAISSENQSQSTSSAAAAVEELTVSIDHVGSSADDASERARSAEEMAVSGAHDVDQASQQVVDVAHRVDETAAQIQSLSEQVQKIGNITVVIRDVADQTNLLALNAAIEAARAGEQGRGFAVVADEVRKLAERTSKATGEIAAMIGDIQSRSQSAVAAMESTIQRLESGTRLAGQAGEAIAAIRGANGEVLRVFSDIDEAMREQGAASYDIAQRVERVAQASEQSSNSVRISAEEASHIRQLADAMRANVERYKV